MLEVIASNEDGAQGQCATELGGGRHSHVKLLWTSKFMQRFNSTFSLNKHISNCKMPSSNFQSSQMVVLDILTQFYHCFLKLCMCG